MTLRDRNLLKIYELQEHCQWAAIAWMDACELMNRPFKISEAHRTITRQYELFCQGRTKGDIEWFFGNHWITKGEWEALLHSSTSNQNSPL